MTTHDDPYPNPRSPDDDAPQAATGRLIPEIEAAQRRIRRLVHPPQARVLAPEQANAALETTETLQQARSLLERAHDEAAAIRAQARAEGLRAGLAEAADALTKARAEHSAMLERAQEDIIVLAFDLTRRLMGHALTHDPDTFAKLLEQTLALAHDRRSVELRVHPEDLARLNTDDPRFARATQAQALRWVADPHVPRFGSHVHTEAGIIEADLDTQLDAFAEALGVRLDPQSQ